MNRGSLKRPRGESAEEANVGDNLANHVQEAMSFEDQMSAFNTEAKTTAAETGKGTGQRRLTKQEKDDNRGVSVIKRKPTLA